MRLLKIRRNAMHIRHLFLLLALGLLLMPLAGCGGDDDDNDDNDDATADDDATDDDATDDDAIDDDAIDDDTVDDDTVDDDTGDDDTIDDDTTDDDTGDDDTGDDDTADIYVAEWPQLNVEVQDYNETPTAGDMRLKAEDYDAWFTQWHQPFYGLSVGTQFTDETRTTVAGYFDYGDSCIWSGTYVVSQAMRYYVTGDPQAKANVIATVNGLSGNLHITGRTGFIARYHGEQSPLITPSNCEEQENCHLVDDGLFAGDFWTGNTSRDQYTGWFFGMATAYDLVDDEDMRQIIRDDVAEVVDELISTNWWITDVDGVHTTAGPNALGTQQLTWGLVAYHVTGEQRFKEVVQTWIADKKRVALQIASINLMNKYTQYYGNNLGHENAYTMLRLGKAYLGEDDYNFLLNLFDKQVHNFTRLSHNAFFTAIHMSQGIYTPTDEDPFQEQLEQDISEFRDAPNFRYYADPQTTDLDPLSVWLDDLMEQFPFLAELMGDVDPQAAEAFPVPEQCSTDFLWQRNPFHVGPCGSDSPNVVNPGIDYLVAYWMSAYHKFITKEQ